MNSRLRIGKTTNLGEPAEIFEIASLSMSLKFAWLSSSVLLVKFTGTVTAHARNAIGTKIFNLLQIYDLEAQHHHKKDEQMN